MSISSYCVVGLIKLGSKYVRELEEGHRKGQQAW